MVFARFYPGYDARIQPVSALGAKGSPIAGLVSGWWIFIGMVFLIFAFSFGKTNYSHKRPHMLTAWLIGIYATGEEIGSGVFPGNHLAGRLTTTGIIHNLIGGIGVLALVLSPFVMKRKYPRIDYPSFNRFLSIISLSGIFVFLLFSITKLNLAGIPWFRSLHGLWQRLFIANYYLFLIVLSLKTAKEVRVL
jgi:hypothetical protein